MNGALDNTVCIAMGGLRNPFEFEGSLVYVDFRYIPSMGSVLN